MKKITLTLLCACVAVLGAFAQKNPVARAEKEIKTNQIDLAKVSIEEATNDEKMKTQYKTWFVRGQVWEAAFINDSSATDEVKDKDLDEVFKSYNKANELDAKKYDLEIGTGIPQIAPARLPMLYNRLFAAGINFYNDQDFENAFKTLKRASRANPTDKVSPYYALTVGSNLDGKLADLTPLADYLLNLKLDPKDTTGKMNGLDNETILRGAYSAKLQALMSENKNNEALEVVTKARKDLPNDRDFLLYESDIYTKTGRIAEAIANIEKAVAAEDPRAAKNPEAAKKAKANLYYSLGILYENNKEVAKANDVYKKAAELDPDNADIAFSVGAAYYNQGIEIRKSYGNWDLNMQKQKEASGELAKLKEQEKGFFGQAMPYVEKAVKAKPNEFQMLGALNEIYIAHGKQAQMVPFFEKAISVEPDNIDVLTSMMNAYEKLGRLNDMVPHFQKALVKNPTDVELLGSLLYMYEKQKNIKAALPYFEAAAKAKPTEPEIMENLVRILKSENRLKDALPYLENANKLKPNNIDLLGTLMSVYYGLNRKVEADKINKQLDKLEAEQKK